MLTFLAAVTTTAVARGQEMRELPPVVVTATKAATPSERLPAAATVIDGDAIRRHHYATVPEALRDVPGVEIQRSGSPGKNTTIKIRGATQEQIQVLVDGMRVKVSTTGEFNPSNLAVDQIERIEVVRGPQATLYGADAIGGVVNIITKRGQGPLTATLGLQGGNLETHREDFSLSGSHKAFDYAVSGSAFETGGSFKNDDSEQRAVAARFGLTLPSGGAVSLFGRYAKTSIDVAVNNPTIARSPFFRLDPDAQQQNELTVLGAEWTQKPVEWWNVTLRVGQMWNERGSQDPRTPGLDTRRTVDQINNRRREIELVNRLHVERWNTLALGLEHRDEWAKSRGSYRRSVETRSVFLQDELRLFDRLFLAAGGRLEDHELFGTEITPWGGLAYLVREWGTKLRGGWGKGFRAPTLNDLFFPGCGDPNLKPERSETWDVGVEQTLRPQRARLEATYFHTDFEDMLTSVRTTVSPFSRAVNLGRVRSRGIEFAAGADFAETLRATLTYTYTDTEDITNKLPLKRVAPHRWNLGLAWDALPTLNVFVQGALVSSQFEAVGFPRNDGYRRLDAGLTYRFIERRGVFPGWALTLRGQNLTDESYMEILGFRAPGINVLAGVQATY